MVINITLGFVIGFVTFDRVWLGCVTPDAACGFACTGLVAASCANAVHPAVRVIAAAKDESGERKVERRPNMRLLRRRLLLRAPRLLVCFRRESLGGQCLG